MKKLSLICMSALLMLAASCKKDKKDGIENAGSGFRATVEQQNGDSKTHLEGTAVKWNSGDAILVKSSTCETPKRFTTTGTDASANFEAAESLPEKFYESPYTAYYPGLESNPAGVYFSGAQLTLPATQTYVENTFANGANPMAVTSSETLLPFKNICGVLKLQLYSTSACKVQSITITTSDATKPLYGTGTVSFGTDGVPALGTLTGGGSTLTLDMGTLGAAMSTSESQPTAYYFVVPAGTLGTAFTVKVTETNGNVWSKTANAATQNEIARSRITVMPKLLVTTKPDIPDGALTGVFTVGMAGSKPRKVYFSKGNLQYNLNSEKWRFAENQYDVLETNQVAVGDDYATYKSNNTNDGWMSLFGWGTSGWNNGNHFYQPYDTDKTTYGSSVGYGYGPTDGNSYNFNLTGDYAKADWGVHNAIINGGNQAGKWRTLKGDAGANGEWEYLLKQRTMTNVKFRYTNTMKDGISIDGKTYKGLFIYPDDYNGTEVGTDETTDTWDEINGLGIVFLPAAGHRVGTSVVNVGSFGNYWSSSCQESDKAKSILISDGTVGTGSFNDRCQGFSVRLVSEK